MQQAITWAKADQNPCRHIASLGHNELKCSYARITTFFITVHTSLLNIELVMTVCISSAAFNTISYTYTPVTANNLHFIWIGKFPWMHAAQLRCLWIVYAVWSRSYIHSFVHVLLLITCFLIYRNVLETVAIFAPRNINVAISMTFRCWLWRALNAKYIPYANGFVMFCFIMFIKLY